MTASHYKGSLLLVFFFFSSCGQLLAGVLARHLMIHHVAPYLGQVDADVMLLNLKATKL